MRGQLRWVQRGGWTRETCHQPKVKKNEASYGESPSSGGPSIQKHRILAWKYRVRWSKTMSNSSWWRDRYYEATGCRQRWHEEGHNGVGTLLADVVHCDAELAIHKCRCGRHLPLQPVAITVLLVPDFRHTCLFGGREAVPVKGWNGQ